MIYRIYTEDKGNQEYIASIVLRRFEGFNITKATGYYKGHKENALCIELDTLNDDNRIGVFNLANDIKIAGKQESVLLQILGVKSILV